MFPFITGISLSEYIRRRRLTLAAFELQTTDVKVIDVAMRYGYQLLEAFARAFKNLHGIIPISARDKGISLKAYPRMSFHISITGDVEMNYRIEQSEKVRAIPKGWPLNYFDFATNSLIPQWT